MKEDKVMEEVAEAATTLSIYMPQGLGLQLLSSQPATLASAEDVAENKAYIRKMIQVLTASLADDAKPTSILVLVKGQYSGPGAKEDQPAFELSGGLLGPETELIPMLMHLLGEVNARSEAAAGEDGVCPGCGKIHGPEEQTEALQNFIDGHNATKH